MPRLAGRDLSVLLVASVAWWLAHAWEGGSAGIAAAVFGAVCGCVLGLAWGFAAHEWGHLLGAVLGGSRIHVNGVLTRPKLFDFRTDENSRRQFLLMAWGGLVPLWIQAGSFAALLPRDSAAGVVGAGFAVAGALFTTAIEAPIATRVALGGALPPAPAPPARSEAAIAR